MQQNNVAGCPPGVPVKLELWRNRDKQAIDSRDAEGSTDATIIIEHAHLHIPIGSLDISLFNTYETTLRKSLAKIRFRRWVIRVREGELSA